MAINITVICLNCGSEDLNLISKNITVLDNSTTLVRVYYCNKCDKEGDKRKWVKRDLLIKIMKIVSSKLKNI